MRSGLLRIPRWRKRTSIGTMRHEIGEKEGCKLKADDRPNPQTLLGVYPIVLHCVAVWFEPTVAGTSCYLGSSRCFRSVDRWIDTGFLTLAASGGFLSYVLVEVGGAPNHERPNRKVNSECKDYLHIMLPLAFARSVASASKGLEACELGLALIRLRRKLRPAE